MSKRKKIELIYDYKDDRRNIKTKNENLKQFFIINYYIPIIILYTLFYNRNNDYYLLINSFFNFPIYILKRRCIHLILFVFKMYLKLLEYLFLYYITYDK